MDIGRQSRVWHLYWFRYKRISGRIYSYQENDTNKYPNIYLWKKINMNIIQMNIPIENDKNIQIFKYSLHLNRVDFDTNEYQNWFIHIKITQRTKMKNDTNEYKIHTKKCSNEYIPIEYSNIFVTLCDNHSFPKCILSELLHTSVFV